MNICIFRKVLVFILEPVGVGISFASTLGMRRALDLDSEYLVSAAELNRRFKEVRVRARTSAVTITHHGKPSLVLLSIDHFRQIAHGAGDSAETNYGRLAMIVDNIGDGFLSIDRDWRIRIVNRVAELFLGHSREELLGKPFVDIFGDSASGMQQARRSMDGGEFVSTERKSDIRPNRRIAITSFPMPPPYDGVGFFFANTTERERVQSLFNQSEAALSALFDDIDDRLLLLVDGDGRIARWGIGGERLLGWTADDVIGRPFASLLAPGVRDQGQPRLRLLDRDGGEVALDGLPHPLDDHSGRTLRILRPVAPR